MSPRIAFQAEYEGSIPFTRSNLKYVNRGIISARLPCDGNPLGHCPHCLVKNDSSGL
jgi:hypothetical protein